MNQDGTVDLIDLSAVDNAAYNFTTGYVVTDLNGDNFVDASDASIVDNNASNFVSVIRP
ncbi:MAG: dockerin type I domain-containing protein [Bacteroidota bacterium]|nr:dockerin type I domain-containing protein [Bacteroidota bacterium]